MRGLVEEGSPYSWGADSDSRAGPTKGQSLLGICAVPTACPTHPSSTGRLQTELQTQLPRTWPLRQAAAGSHPSTLELEAVFPAPRKFQHSQKYRSSKGRQVSLRSPSAQVTLSTPTKPCTSGRQGLPEAHCPQTQQGKEAPGALTGGYVGHHLGTTVKDGTQQDSIPNAVVQSRETLPVPHLPQAQLINTVQKC